MAATSAPPAARWGPAAEALNLGLPYTLGLAALLASGAASAQVYTWKDPQAGTSRFSNVAPPWYRNDNVVNGPRVVVSIGRQVVDDTALPMEKRMALSGRTPSNGKDRKPQVH